MRPRRGWWGSGTAQGIAGLVILLTWGGPVPAADDGVRPSLGLGSVTVHRQRNVTGGSTLDTAFHWAEEDDDALAWCLIATGLLAGAGLLYRRRAVT